MVAMEAIYAPTPGPWLPNVTYTCKLHSMLILMRICGPTFDHGYHRVCSDTYPGLDHHLQLKLMSATRKRIWLAAAAVKAQDKLAALGLDRRLSQPKDYPLSGQRKTDMNLPNLK
jgi:hypothetical protein